MGSMIISNLIVDSIVTFLPLHIQLTKWDGLAPDEDDITLIIAVFSVAELLFATVNSKIKKALGGKNTILMACVEGAICNIGLALSVFITNPKAFTVVCVLIRFIQGQANIQLDVTSWSIVTKIFNEGDELEKFIGYLELANSLGQCIGPILGAVFYSMLGYQGILLSFAVMNVGALVMSFQMLPNELNG